MRFDELIHQPTRLKIMAYLTGLGSEAQVEFGTLQRELGLTEGNLSRHLAKLEEAGYLRIEKGYAKKRPRTWIRLTGAGRDALQGHLAALEELARTARYPGAAGREKR
ncbi:transcriptional regulator [Oceanithermus profundus DSM 14977]|uniref:Transcriptional regulator n=1 Tax=Oceanithermus profundus (strain DSM 14977 / NBRC 100410 / VKM B-2274 / 506) TaxID=670487 RepID=E4U8Y5_OCEP5|nr:transcriptional regulator [Oceanithermus profundus]ADR36815.1 transcriptional regulator [Oceanithermus profundus DSM 14977]